MMGAQVGVGRGGGGRGERGHGKLLVGQVIGCSTTSGLGLLFQSPGSWVPYLHL